MVIPTEKEWAARLLKIRGVKSVAFDYDQDQPGKVGVVVRYKFWTYLLPWCNRRASRKVHEFIYGHKPFSIGVTVNGK